MTSLPFQQSGDFVSSRFKGVHHDIAVVLGSGLGSFTRHLTDKIALESAEIPDYPRSTVPGHLGEIVSAKVAGKRVLVFSGRVHFYETASTIDAAVTAIVSHQLGIKKIVLTNAAGILDEKFSPGDLMLIKDQINLTSRNVLADLRMPKAELNPMYSERLAAAALLAAQESCIDLKSGTYLGLTGPSYETPAEVKFYRGLGGNAVGMSTIHEATFARSVNMEVIGISCLTNYSAGTTLEKLSHDDVLRIGENVDEKFSRLLLKLVEII
ncbi:MAG TPA: purine-nucleoside phosphorylase [Candidatus Acidoferrales bacterium]|nr:purine-nucleoside phosphorylase [Candidatus Acidoferrales bacterium]